MRWRAAVLGLVLASAAVLGPAGIAKAGGIVYWTSGAQVITTTPVVSVPVATTAVPVAVVPPPVVVAAPPPEAVVAQQAYSEGYRDGYGEGYREGYVEGSTTRTYVYTSYPRVVTYTPTVTWPRYYVSVGTGLHRPTVSLPRVVRPPVVHPRIGHPRIGHSGFMHPQVRVGWPGGSVHVGGVGISIRR